MRRTLAVGVAVTALAVGCGPVPAAHAGDRCVGKYEAVFSGGRHTRPVQETDWGVRGRGVRITVPIFGDVWAYPLCGLSFPTNFAFAKFGADGKTTVTGYFDLGLNR